VARLLDTIPSFLAYAKRAAPEAPWLRENLWKEQYHSAHPKVFKAYAVHQGEPAPRHLSHRLYTVRQTVERAAALWPAILEEAEPRVRKLLEAEEVVSPLHVLMVGTFTTNAFVGRLGSEAAVCSGVSSGFRTRSPLGCWLPMRLLMPFTRSCLEPSPRQRPGVDVSL